LSGFLATVKATLFSRYADPGAQRLLDQWSEEQPNADPLVQIQAASETLEESRA
jgi:hypothetical protein